MRAAADPVNKEDSPPSDERILSALISPMVRCPPLNCARSARSAKQPSTRAFLISPALAVSCAHPKDISWPTPRSDGRALSRLGVPGSGSQSLYSAWEPEPGTTSKSLLRPPSKSERLLIL